jgi:hypothetical protein
MLCSSVIRDVIRSCDCFKWRRVDVDDPLRDGRVVEEHVEVMLYCIDSIAIDIAISELAESGLYDAAAFSYMPLRLYLFAIVL